MKLRTCFVSNSSSTSYIVGACDGTSIWKVLELQRLSKGNKPYESCSVEEYKHRLQNGICFCDDDIESFKKSLDDISKCKQDELFFVVPKSFFLNKMKKTQVIGDINRQIESLEQKKEKNKTLLEKLSERQYKMIFFIKIENYFSDSQLNEIFDSETIFVLDKETT